MVPGERVRTVWREETRKPYDSIRSSARRFVECTGRRKGREEKEYKGVMCSVRETVHNFRFLIIGNYG